MDVHLTSQLSFLEYTAQLQTARFVQLGVKRYICWQFLLLSLIGYSSLVTRTKFAVAIEDLYRWLCLCALYSIGLF